MESRRALPDKKYFKIGEVADLVGVEPHVLRYWETQFPQVRPNKARSGHRLYRRREVEALLVIRELLHVRRFTIAGARQALRQPGGYTALLPQFFQVAPGEGASKDAVAVDGDAGALAAAGGDGTEVSQDSDGPEHGDEALEGEASGPIRLSGLDHTDADGAAVLSDEAREPNGDGFARAVAAGEAHFDEDRRALLRGALADARLILALLDRDDARERIHP